MNTLITILLFLAGCVISFLIGLFGSKLFVYLQDRNTKKNIKHFLTGKRANKISLDDGRVLNVNKFITYNEKGEKILIEMKGGGVADITTIKDAKKEKRNNKRRVSPTDTRLVRKNSKRIGRKKRNNERRNFFRKFG